MDQEIEFTRPGAVRLVPMARTHPAEGEVLVETSYSGISAGTELTAFVGTNPYVHKRWDARRRLFVEGGPTFAYPIRGWGYEEVGRVVELGNRVDPALLGSTIWGIWGHRSIATIQATTAAAQLVGPGADPVCGIFARPGAVALNALLDSNAHSGETMVIFGQGVIGLLLAALASAADIRVVAVDPVKSRLEMAQRFGASELISDPTAAAEIVRSLTDDRGAEVSVELSGKTEALAEAVRSVGLNGLVVAAGFYQGEARGLYLGEEFHHNRVRLISSQIGCVNPSLSNFWDRDRLHLEFMQRVVTGHLDPLALVTQRFPVTQCQAAFDLLCSGDQDVLQVVLEFGD